ncbi:MAG: hypothetical protein KIT22_08910 [Verrucomicrobiae bacterium]|nr:hypothetical protein [Verrucomicrobiae bacterium]
MRPEIQFSSAFPDDSIEDGGDFVQWPGRNVAEALKGGLEERGYRVSDPVDAQHVGWELDIWRGRKRFWLRISILEPELNYLMAKNMTFFLWPDVKLFRAFLADLQAVLEADHRFGQVRWFPKSGIDGRAAPASGPFND